MGPAQFSNLLSLLFLILSVLGILGFSADETSMVFKGCANQKFEDPAGVYLQALDTLYDSLISQSASSRFYKTTGGQGQSAIFGLFQCRGDLSPSRCNDCVKKTPKLMDQLCGETIAARIQLQGCYMRYEVSGFKDVSGTELLYKTCGSTQASGPGFRDTLDTALGEIVKGVGNGNGNGFYAGGYEAVYVLGQCEGDLSTNDCVQCVKNAIQSANTACGYSLPAQIYLQECYISYSYYPNGVPAKSLPSGTKQVTQKTVAMVLGGLVAVGLIMACLLVIKSAFKKKTKSKFYTYNG